MSSTILVPLDGSEFAEHALPFALDVARRLQARLTLVTVHEPPPLAHGVRAAPGHELAIEQRRDAELRRQRDQYLESTRERLRASDTDIAVDAVPLDGHPADALVDYALDEMPLLVVMTTHGRGGVSRLWLGSVTEALVRRTTFPVLAVRPAEASAPRASVHRVLIGVDGSPEAEAVIAPALTLFGRSAEYTLLRVVPPLHPLVRAVATDWEYSRDLGQEQRLASTYVQALAERLAPPDAEIDVATRGNLAPADGIVTVADELDVDVIALATHARGALGRLVFGSVADKVLRATSRAVLLYHVTGETPAAEAPAAEAATTVVSTRRLEISIG